MKHLSLILSILPLAAHAEWVPNPLSRFHEQMTYIVDGVSMYVNCRCDLDDTRSFDIGVEADFAALPQAAEVAFDVANEYCAVRFASTISVEPLGGRFGFDLEYQAAQGVWLLSGRCA